MRWGRWAAAAAIAFGWAQAAAAQPQDFSRVQVNAERVAGNVYMLTGAGGNIGAVVGDDGIAIVDDQFAPLADKIRAALKSVTDKPLRFVINTHYHYDHTGGNAKDATIVAHDNVRRRLASGSEMGTGATMREQQKPDPPHALPVVTFGHDLTLHLNGEEIRALHVPHGHTDGAAIVWFKKANVVHMGDVFVTYGFPFIDIAAGGSSAGMAAGLEAAIKQLPADVKVIPGHGPVSTVADVRRYVAMLRETRAVVERGVKAGKSLKQLQDEKVLAKWQSLSGDFITTDLFIETLYNEIRGRPGGPPVRHN
jgi:cyclase